MQVKQSLIRFDNQKDKDVEFEIISLKNRLGNLTLLQSRINSEEGNATFDSKKSRFEQSELWITKMIAEEYESWDENNITDRQQKLSEIAVQTWNLNLN